MFAQNVMKDQGAARSWRIPKRAPYTSESPPGRYMRGAKSIGRTGTPGVIRAMS